MWNPCQSCVCDRKAETKSWVHRSRVFFCLKTPQSVSGRLYRFLSQILSSVGWPRHIHAMENCIWFSLVKMEAGPPHGYFDGEHDDSPVDLGNFGISYFQASQYFPILNPNILGVSNQYWILLQDTSDESSVFSKNKFHDCSEKTVGSSPLGRNPIEKWDAQWICREMV